jgi:hypothetical protein
MMRIQSSSVASAPPCCMEATDSVKLHRRGSAQHSSGALTQQPQHCMPNLRIATELPATAQAWVSTAPVQRSWCKLPVRSREPGSAAANCCAASLDNCAPTSCRHTLARHLSLTPQVLASRACDYGASDEATATAQGRCGFKTLSMSKCA